MANCEADSTVERVRVGSMTFPLGVYPVEQLAPRQGYSLSFEPADGDDGDGEWEEWPDRYVFDAVISAERLEALCRHVFALFPPRIYPILDIIGRDAYREIDPYVAWDPTGLDRFIDTVRTFRPFFFEDGFTGFGAMSEEPFLYAFVDEHKILTIRAEASLKDRVESVLHAFDLEPCEDPAGADSAVHEHRSVIVAPADRTDLLSFEEIVERLRDTWKLILNIDPETNVDDDGRPLGVTPWRCLARVLFTPARETPDPGDITDRDADLLDDAPSEPPETRYIEILLHAACLLEAEELAEEAADKLIDAQADLECLDASLVSTDRLRPEDLKELARAAGARPRTGAKQSGIIVARFLEA